MKLNFYALLFAVFAGIILWATELQLSETAYIDLDQDTMDDAFDIAVIAATSTLPDEIEDIASQGEDVVSEFFESLYSSYGIMSAAGKENLAMYVPVIAITQKDGLYIRYTESTVLGDGTIALVSRWSEKIPYSYEDPHDRKGFVYRLYTDGRVMVYDRTHSGIMGEDFMLVDMEHRDAYDWFLNLKHNTTWGGRTMLASDIYDDIKRTVITDTIEESLGLYINRYNTIAKQRGISYEFSLPAIDTRSYQRASEGCTFIAFFQGYPIKGAMDTYSRYTIASAQLSLARKYLVLENAEGTRVFHSENCPYIPEEHLHSSLCQPGCTKQEWRKVAEFGTVIECEQAGAYSCEHCVPNAGVHANPKGYDSYSWNQMLDDAFLSGEGYGVTYAYDAETHSMSISGIATTPERTWPVLYRGIHLIEGRVYYLKANKLGESSENVYLKYAVFPEDRAFLPGGLIFTATQTRDTYIFMVLAPDSQWNCTYSFQLVDLTEMFGAGKEPSNVAMFNDVCARLRIDLNEYNEACSSVTVRAVKR